MKALKLLVLGVLLVLVAVPMAGAQGGGTWDSSFNVVNLGSSDAQQVDVTFYLESTGTAYHPATLKAAPADLTNPFPLAAGASVEIQVFLDTNMASGRYSVVISADQPIAAIANLTNWIATQGGSPPYFNGSYSGVGNMGQTAVYMPAIVSNYWGWSSNLAVQNLTGSAQTIVARFYHETNGTVCATITGTNVPAYTSWYPTLPNLTTCDANSDGYNGAAVMSGAGAVAAVDNQTSPVDVGAGAPGRTQTYNGFAVGNSTLYAPALYYRYWGWDSSINVQNSGTASTVVTVTYSDGYVITQTLPAKGGHLFYQWAEGGAGHHTALTKFSATITSDGEPLVAVINAATNQEPVPGYAPQNQAQTYSAVVSGGTSVGFPLIMREYWGWYTSYTVQNVGAAPVNLLVSYSGIVTCTNLALGPIAVGANVEIYQGTLSGASEICAYLPGADAPGSPGLASYRGAVTVVVNGAGSIAGIVNQTNYINRDTASTTGDWSQSYNGLPGQ